MNNLELKKIANEVRKGIIISTHAAKAGHPGGSLSAADIFTYLYFEEMQNRIVKFISEHSKASPETLKELMMCPDELATDVGSIVDGKEAVKYGIIDEVGGLSDALDALREMIDKNKEDKI